jgi:LPXTG-site transpeptidase (sortase) family protein
VVRWPGPRYLLGAASCMTPDLTTRPASRAPRGLARFIAGLVLVAVTAACSSSDQNDVTPASSAAPTSAVNASPSTGTTASRQATEAPPEPTANQTERIEGGFTLRIPRIGVDAPVVPIQSNEDRVLNPPRDPSVVGWWSDGAAPGKTRGSAVLVGHTVRNKGGGVFDDMGDLSRGDAIEVKKSGSTFGYRVKSTDVLSKTEVARNAEEIFAQTGAGRLVIITCDDWDGSAWRSNIVTIATPV